MRSVWGTFPEYHTSGDNLGFILPKQLAQSFRLCATIVDILERNAYYCTRNPYCEPQLGRRNLYRSSDGEQAGTEVSARLWVLNFADGNHSLLEIAERSKLPFAAISEAADLLSQEGLLSVVRTPDGLAA